tara:strand:+ start:36 stop:275 length:240 start_codon:yes stop_codon:yes gene_type:complete
MKNAYMSEWEIQALAEAALTSYEGTASWSRAFEAAVEFSADEWEIKATKAQAATAVAIAKTGWQGIKQSVQKVQYRPQY